jgi:anti-sigma regulatory factor (Ser/Thr protein kinase)
MEGHNGMGENEAQALPRVLGEYAAEASMDSLDGFIEFACDHAAGQGFADDRVQEVRRVLTEALTNIVTFTFDNTPREIKLSCKVDKFGKYVLALVDSGKAYNMLLEDDPFIGSLGPTPDGPRPSTKTMKRFSSNIEYKRLENRNHLIITLARDMKKGKE